MSELGYVEKPVLGWLAELGWTVLSREEMAAHGRDPADPLVPALLVPAVRRLNPQVTTDADAERAVGLLRQCLAHPDPLARNRDTLRLLVDGVPLQLRPGADAVTVRFFGFGPDELALNTFVATSQYPVAGAATVRPDTVLLVNGVPLVVAEFKSFLKSGKDWTEGVRQLHRYQAECPAVLAPSVFCAAADEQQFRYGTVAFQEGEDAARRQIDRWGPWLSLYPEVVNHWSKSGPGDDPLRDAVRGLLRPATVLDFLQHFVLFETSGGRTVKKVARYHQFEAANRLVDRTVEVVGNPAATPQDRTGLVWHTQGSGKSLTMVYAGTKLRRHPKLGSPTVLVVVDRTDLKTQLADDFVECDYPNVSKALGVEDLKARLRADTRETIVTTVQCFQNMGDLAPVTRDNVVLLIDEAHRSQKGAGRLKDGRPDPGGFAHTMRVKLPNAVRFGFTGTPIDRTLTNTHREFGPERDGKQERYLSYYGIRQAIRDGATLPVHYLLRPVPLTVDQQPLDVGFEQMCDEAEVSEEEAKDHIQRKEARWKALAKDDKRMAVVAAEIVRHLLLHPDPSGFKAQVVAVDREAAARYKGLIDAELVRAGYTLDQAQATTEVVISAAQNDLDKALLRHHYTKEQADALIARFKQTPAEYERQYQDIDSADRPAPLKLLIVCDKLLTGFDAPVEQVMYLDRPLRDHTLLQAMARTNRPLPDMGKSCGLIVDLFGVFADLRRALNFDEAELEEVAVDWEKLKATVPGAVARCLRPFGKLRLDGTRERLADCLACLADDATGKAFREDFLHLETLWEAVSPDADLDPHTRDYAFLCEMYVAYLRRHRREQATYEGLAAKTRRLIRAHATVSDVNAAIPVYVIDADYVARTRELPTAADRAAELKRALTAELIEGGGGGCQYRLLGERLAKLLADRTAELSRMILELEELAGAVAGLKTEAGRLGLSPAGYALFVAARVHAPGTAEKRLVAVARDMAAALDKARCLTKGWSDLPGAAKKVRQTLLVATWQYPDLALCPDDVDDPPFLADAVDELARVAG